MSALARLYSVQALPTGKVSIMPRPRGGDWLTAERAMCLGQGVSPTLPGAPAYTR